MAMIKRGKMWYTDDWDSGHRIRRALDRNERIAKNLYQDFKESLRARRLGIIPKNTTLDNFERKLLDFVKSEKSHTTYRRMKLSFERLKEESSIRKLHEITPELLEQLKIKWKEKYQPSAISSYVVAIKTAMKIAESWKYIAPQNWNTVRIYVPPARTHYFTLEQLNKVISLCKEPYLTAALLMCRAGLRSGEVRHLKFEDIDLERKNIWIHGKPCNTCLECKHRGNYWIVKSSKPGKPKERYVDMPKDLQHHFGWIRGKTGWVLGPEMIHESTYRMYFIDLSIKAGIPVSPHKFRHTYGAQLASAGRSLLVIGELLGQSDPVSTKIYSHLLPHARREAVDDLPELGS